MTMGQGEGGMEMQKMVNYWLQSQNYQKEPGILSNEK